MTVSSADRVIALIDGAIGPHYEVSPDAMRCRPTPPAPPVKVCVGDVVNYHGSVTDVHGECVVTEVQAGTARYCLWIVDGPRHRLKLVRRESFTPTGRWVPVCRCTHPLTDPATGATGTCPRPECDCPHH